jgi:hypothetical protein
LIALTTNELNPFPIFLARLYNGSVTLRDSAIAGKLGKQRKSGGATRERMSGSLTEQIIHTVKQLENRQLALPALLYLDAHRPLRFFAGQVLFAAAPLASLLGFDDIEDWAAVLNDPDAYAHLQQALENAVRTQQST